MKPDDPQAARLIEFCMRLPQTDADPVRAGADARWVLRQFEQRRQELLQVLGSAQGAAEHRRPAIRCEIDALDAAASVINQFWQRRFGAAPAGD